MNNYAPFPSRSSLTELSTPTSPLDDDEAKTHNKSLINSNKNGSVVVIARLSLEQTPSASTPPPHTHQSHVAKSICTNDPAAPIISLSKAKNEFKTVSQAALRFQFVCETYHKCKQGTVKEKDFVKLEDVLRHVYDQLLKRQLRNSECKQRPKLCKISNTRCNKCNKSVSSNECYTTCNHALCIKCLVYTFSHSSKTSKWYICPIEACVSLLPPETHFFVLSFKPSPKNVKSNHLTASNDAKCKIMHKKMVSDYIKMRNNAYKNMLKTLGEYFSSKLKHYPRWRKCENCEFGFLADPDVDWHQVFELKCSVCNVIQRVQLIAPEPCNKLCLKKSYYPNDSMFKTLVFIRHAEAQNNINPSDPNLRDPNLTHQGKKQCQHLHEHFGSMLSLDCILSSSMNRCLQTAIIGLCKKESIPFIALECLRERLSPMFNRRENISIKKEKYKSFGIDFSECKIDDDTYFDEEKKNEKYEDMNKRAWQFYKYLLKRQQQRIAIVSHEGMLQCLMNIIETNDKCLRRSFKNAEARLCFLTRRK